MVRGRFGITEMLAGELAITIANPDVWVSIGLALLLGGGCWVFGTWVARTVGLLQSSAPVGETLAVGLASGLMVAAAWWAAIWSGGRSSFTPVAVGFAIALALALMQRVRHRFIPGVDAGPHDLISPEQIRGGSVRGLRSLILTASAAGLFVVLIGLLYGSTLTLSPRDGLQPVEKTDVAFYAVLGRDLATTGAETNTLPSGFSDLVGQPAQTWYHWGELWLASAVITIFGSAPLAARHLVVLPLLLLAAAALAGTLVRRLGGTESRPAFLFGFVTCLVLAPVPLVAGPFFSVWATGLISGITKFGLAAVAGMFALYLLAVMPRIRPGWTVACFAGSAVALLLPAHIVIAFLALFGVVSLVAVRIGRSVLATRRPPSLSSAWWRTVVATAVAALSTVAWGLLTDHGIGGGGPLMGVLPFNASWRDSVAIIVLGGGMLLSIPVTWLVAQRVNPTLADICLAATLMLIVGAIAWGRGLATFNTFYFLFGGIAVFATPIAAAAMWTLIERLRSSPHPRLAVGAIALCVVQLEFGAMISLAGLQGHSPAPRPIPVSLLQAIEQLPEDAKVAYACQAFEEISFVNSKLLAIDARTGRRVVPMCFQADVMGPLLGMQPSAHTPDAGFAQAPQRRLYPDSTARPSPLAVSAFLRAYGIQYVYSDAAHPNTLVADAIPVATSGDAELLRIP